MQINSKTLPNGLQIIHNEDKTTQMVAVNTLYMVGSRNEEPEHTGFAHLFEHLMFGGSINIPDYDKQCQQASGENNAFTDVDFTNYYVMMPATNIETALWLESDRMLSLAFTPQSLEVQRKVVMEEFKQNYINQPYGDISHLLFANIYKVHPYRWPTIGLSLSHIENATMDQVRSFFKRFYRPDNAIISIVGNISWEKTQQLVEKWYGDIPRGTEPMGKELIPQEPRQLRIRRKTVRRNVPNDVLVITFNIPKFMDPEFKVCDMITDVLANGKSSRFNAKLVEKQKLFLSLDASVIGRLDNGLLVIEGVMPEGADVDVCEQAVWNELGILKHQLVEKRELQKIKNKFETNHYLQSVNYLQRAQNLAHYAAFGDVHAIETEIKNYCSISPEQIQSAARKYFTKRNAAVLRYLKSKSEK